MCVIENIKREINGVLFFGVAMFLCILCVANMLHLSNKAELIGVTLTSYPSNLSIKTVFDGSFLQGWEKWFEDNFYGHTAAVKLRNQFAYSVFRDGNSDWMCGTDEVLYKKSEMYLYVGGNRANGRTQQEYDNYAEQLYLLQEKLKDAGKDFVYIITPFKAEIYPEYLPWYDAVLQKKYADQKSSVKKSLIRALKKSGVNYFDTTDVLREIRENGEYPVFSQTGHHWTLAAAAEAFDTLLSDLEMKTKGLHYPHISIEGMIDKLYERDRDLYADLNLFSEGKNIRYQSPVIHYSQQSDLSVYLFGTSFTLEVSDAVSKDISKRPFDSFFVQEYLSILQVTDENGQIRTRYKENNKMYDRAILSHIRESDIVMMEQPGISGLMDTHIKFLDYVNKNFNQLYYTPGDNILLYTEDPQSFEHFFDLQDDLRWMEGTKGTIHFHGNEIKGISGELFLSMNLCSYYLDQEVDVLFNNEKLCTIGVTPIMKDYRIEIPETLVQKDENQVTFILHGEVYSPKNLGESKDSRNLGLGFTSLSIDGGID